MAVSNSTDFKLSAGEMVEEARRKCGIHADEEPMTAQELQTGLRLLNMMLKAWQAEGVTCWTTEEGQIDPLIEGDESYTFGAGGNFVPVPLEILSVRINRAGNDLPMSRLGRADYYDLPNKTNKGYPTQFYYERKRSGGILFIWPAPDAGLGTLKFSYRRLIMDLDLAPDDFDVPQEWHEAILYGLSRRIAENYGVLNTPEGKNIVLEADRTYAVVKGFDIGEGEGTLTITPGYYRYA